MHSGLLMNEVGEPLGLGYLKIWSRGDTVRSQGIYHRWVPIEETLWSHMEGVHSTTTLQLEVPRRANVNEPARIATIQVSFDQLSLQPPPNRTYNKDGNLEPISVYAVFAHEIWQKDRGIKKTFKKLLKTFLNSIKPADRCPWQAPPAGSGNAGEMTLLAALAGPVFCL